MKPSTTPPAVDEAPTVEVLERRHQAACDDLAEVNVIGAGLASQFRAAVRDGDLDRALSVHRQIDEQPIRLVVAEARVLRAAADLAAARAAGFQPEIDRLDVEFDARKRALDEATNVGDRPEFERCRAALDEIAVQARRAGIEQRAYLQEAQVAERELAAKFAARPMEAPLVRSLPHLPRTIGE